MYIGSLQWWTTDAEIEALCSPYGAVQKIIFFEEKPSGKSKGYCLVTFDSPKGAYLCKQSLDGYVPSFTSSLALLCTEELGPLGVEAAIHSKSFVLRRKRKGNSLASIAWWSLQEGDQWEDLCSDPDQVQG